MQSYTPTGITPLIKELEYWQPIKPTFMYVGRYPSFINSTPKLTTPDKTYMLLPPPEQRAKFSKIIQNPLLQVLL